VHSSSNLVSVVVSEIQVDVTTTNRES